MKRIKEKLLNIWWKYRGRKKFMPFTTFDEARYGRVITVIRYHDSLLVVCERSMWQIRDNFNIGSLEAVLITDGRM